MQLYIETVHLLLAAMDIGALAHKINSQSNIKAGTLRFWGEWFGKPYDNYHRISQCTAVGESLIIEFEGGEQLKIEKPHGITASAEEFCVIDAEVVRWEWHYYGRPKTAQNLYFIEYVKKGSLISGSSNVDWYSPKFEPSVTEKAIELL